MAFQSTRSDPFKTPHCRFSYAKSMFERVVKKDDFGKPILDDKGKEITEQQCTLIFDKTPENLTVFEKVILGVITVAWGDTAVQRFKTGLIRSPILLGDGKEARDKKTGEIRPGLGADKFFLRVATRMDAPIRYRSEQLPATYGDGPDQIKSGDYGFAMLSAYTWNNAKNGDGVSFGIHYLQKLRDGESLGGSGQINVAEVYEAVQGASSLAGAGVSANSLFA